jgi:general secretion pathway protein G
MEMVVVLAIVSVLAAMAIPQAAKQAQRAKEMELRSTLREVRTAIDRFHEDWSSVQGASRFASVASADGYPLSFDVLIKGVEGGGPNGRKRRYLRALPRNPFAPADADLKDQWRIVSYQEDPKGGGIKGRDVYDIRANTEGVGLDGIAYAEW